MEEEEIIYEIKCDRVKVVCVNASCYQSDGPYRAEWKKMTQVADHNKNRDRSFVVVVG